jgi:hypothetical protein
MWLSLMGKLFLMPAMLEVRSVQGCVPAYFGAAFFPASARLRIASLFPLIEPAGAMKCASSMQMDCVLLCL